MRKMFFVVWVAVMILGATSCSKETLLNEEKGFLYQPTSEIQCVNDILILPNEQMLNDLLAGKSEIPEHLKGVFTSQRDIFESIVQKEYQYGLALDKLVDGDYSGVELHSSYYKDLLANQVIKEVKYTDGSDLYQLNLCLPNYAKVLNQEGYFAVGDTIYQITPNQFKIWKNGDFENYKWLGSIEKTDENKNVYVYDYSGKQQGVMTKSLFPLHSIDQKVAFANTSMNYSGRFVLSFYDKTGLDLPGYKRETYIRVSFQDKVGGTYRFVSKPYTLEAYFWTYVEDVEKPKIDMNAQGTGSDVWYTVYLPYGMLVEGKNVQTATDVYWYIKKFSLQMYTSQGGCSFSGTRPEPTSGNFFYEPLFDTITTVRLNELLPE